MYQIPQARRRVAQDLQKAAFLNVEPAEFDEDSVVWTKPLPALALSTVLSIDLEAHGRCSAIVASGDLWVATPIIQDQGFVWAKELESLVKVFGDGTANGDTAPEIDTSELEDVYGYEVTTDVFDELGGADEAEVEA